MIEDDVHQRLLGWLLVCTLNLICCASSFAPRSSALGLLLGLRVKRAEHMEEPHTSQMKSWDLFKRVHLHVTHPVRTKNPFCD